MDRHPFVGRLDRPCELCHLPDRNPIHMHVEAVLESEGDVVPLNRNIVQFTEQDAAQIIGRPLTEAEYQRLIKVTEFEMPLAFAEMVNAVITNDEEDPS